MICLQWVEISKSMSQLNYRLVHEHYKAKATCKINWFIKGIYYLLSVVQPKWPTPVLSYKLGV